MATKKDRAILNSVFNPLLPLGECPIEDIIPEELKDDEEGTPEVEEAKRLEIEAVKAAELKNVDEAIEIFNASIKTAPNRPSVYNNRAQAYRLKGDITAALHDLNNSLNLSEGRGRSGCLALCQRALIYRFQGQAEKASEDFKKAASLGSAFAKSQLTMMNPYAALCNQMLSQVMTQYRKGKNQIP